MSFSFGTPSSAPATGGLSGGFSFGTNKPATPGFGLTATSQPSTGLFGSTPTTSAPSFGTPAFGSTTPAFGATSSAPTFGGTATPAFGSTPAFGQTTPAFGASSAAPAFGTTTPAFGTAAPSFGATTTPAFGASAAPAFGSTTTPAFGTSGLGTGGLNFGTGTNTSTAATGLNFSTPATTASTGLGGLGGFGFGTTTQSLGFGLLGSTSTATTTNSLFGPKLSTTSVTGTQPSTLQTTSLGLGGAAQSSGIASTTTDSKNEPPKQTKLPNEISTSVDNFKEFVKKQKAMSSEVMRVSIKPLYKVSREAEAKLREALALGGGVARARAHSRRLIAAAAAALAATEAANRDYTITGSELEGTAPPSYVKELIAELEQQLITFRRQMEVADKQMQSSTKLLTEQELNLGIRRMHESLVALAGRLQAVHTQVEAQKEQYLNLRKYVLKDPTNVFDTTPYQSTSLDHILRDSENNRKKVKSGTLTDLSLGSAVLTDPKAALGSLHQLAGPTPFSYIGSALSPYPAADTNGPTWQPTPQQNVNTSMTIGSLGMPPAAEPSTGFQLQKPPGKRGKQ
ncbi:hypothetical protein K1T71_011908 [Dendrolimus kikuchii]|uniref:Uncharacterized protein n=1 Tax=Dendrolimus kikuchii TaxID=765133 RepID=A0ACC1CMF0_9NEOP|nr:hypothetical protein K1T71_011908 [Dendrolimus kikuchii]